MKQTYSVLKAPADGEQQELRIVESGVATRGMALKHAKQMPPFR